MMRSDSREIRKVVGVEWSKRFDTFQAQKVTSNTEDNLENFINNQGDADLQPYYINEEMFEMISRCPAPFNNTRTLVKFPPP